MKRSRLFIVCVLALLPALIMCSFNLWAQKPVPENVMENVYALDSDNFFYTCYHNEGYDECVFICLGCGWSTAPQDGTFGRVVGKCPICKLEYPDTVKYDGNTSIRW